MKKPYKDRDDEYSPNPDFNRPALAEHPDATKARLYRLHRLTGGMEHYYDLYPEDRPLTPEPARPRSGGRGGR